MNGGTSIASAIQKAGQLLKTVDRAAQPAAPGDGADVEAVEAGPGHHDDNVGDEAAEVAAQVRQTTGSVRHCGNAKEYANSYRRDSQSCVTLLWHVALAFVDTCIDRVDTCTNQLSSLRITLVRHVAHALF
jgi:hypothetical protein